MSEITVELVAERSLEAWEEAVACDSCDVRKSVGWYRRKSYFIRQNKGEYTFKQACAIYAVISQDRNVPINDRLFLQAIQGEEIAHYGDVKARIRLIWQGEEYIEEALTYINGKKIPSFFENLYHPRAGKQFTADRHMGDIITRDRKLTKTMLQRPKGRGYYIFADGYRLTARRLGMLPLELQAALWVHHKECNGGIKANVA